MRLDEAMTLTSWVATQMKGPDEYGRRSVMLVPIRNKSPYRRVTEGWHRFSRKGSLVGSLKCELRGREDTLRRKVGCNNSMVIQIIFGVTKIWSLRLLSL